MIKSDDSKVFHFFKLRLERLFNTTVSSCSSFIVAIKNTYFILSLSWLEFLQMFWVELVVNKSIGHVNNLLRKIAVLLLSYFENYELKNKTSEPQFFPFLMKKKCAFRKNKTCSFWASIITNTKSSYIILLFQVLS